jgi:enoyl-CoA hydratase/carnithine racemase
MRIASESASFAFREVKRGLFETNGVMYLLSRIAGSGRAAEWLLTGEDVSAKIALTSGLVSRVVPDGDLLDVAKKIANELAANAPTSVRLVKQALKRTYDMDFEAVMQLEVDGVLECLASEDFVEGIRSFVEKRPPRFKGR